MRLADLVDHPEHAALLANIRANPDDDLSRYVYADWLDDHGANDRAKFIRYQLDEVPTPSGNAWAADAVRAHHRDWAGLRLRIGPDAHSRLPWRVFEGDGVVMIARTQGGGRILWTRGFIDTVQLPADHLLGITPKMISHPGYLLRCVLPTEMLVHYSGAGGYMPWCPRPVPHPDGHTEYVFDTDTLRMPVLQHMIDAVFTRGATTGRYISRTVGRPEGVAYPTLEAAVAAVSRAILKRAAAIADDLKALNILSSRGMFPSERASDD